MPCRPFITGKKTVNYAISSRMHRTGSIRISDLALFIACTAITWAGSIPFTDRIWLRLLLTITGCLLLRWSVKKWLDGRQLIFIKEQFKWLLEHLLTRMTAGATLERAFLDASTALSKILGKNTLLLSGLVLLEKQLAAHLPLIQILPRFSQFLPCPEAHRFLLILPELSQAGGQTSQFIRQQLGMIHEQLSLQQDISAESTQRRTEAVILSVMPFLMAFMLRRPSAALSGGMMISPLGTISMLTAWSMAIFAAVLTIGALHFRIQSEQIPSGSSSRTTRKPQLQILMKIGQRLFILYQNWLPVSYSGRILQFLMADPCPSVVKCMTPAQIYFSRKVALILISLVPSCLLIHVFPDMWYLWLFVPLLMPIIQDQQIFRMVQHHQTQYQLEYPVFLNLISSLLHAGLSVHIALDICMRACLEESASNQNTSVYTVISRDLYEIRKNLQIGLPASQILEKIAVTCPIPEARAALLLIAKYDRAGGQEILLMLQMQASSCQSLYRNTVRKQLELHALRLLLPMTLDLMSVIIITILPAVLSLQSI